MYTTYCAKKRKVNINSLTYICFCIFEAIHKNLIIFIASGEGSRYLGDEGEFLSCFPFIVLFWILNHMNIFSVMKQITFKGKMTRIQIKQQIGKHWQRNRHKILKFPDTKTLKINWIISSQKEMKREFIFSRNT